MNYKLAAPLAAIGRHRLRQLDEQIAARTATARRILHALPVGGRLAELGYQPGDAPNYYNLVLTAAGPAPTIAGRLTAAGLPPDSVRYGYRTLYHQPIFTPYARLCRNAELLAASAIQLPVHPALRPAEIQWVVRCAAAAAQRESE